MDAQKTRPISPDSLSERWQQQWQHFIVELTQCAGTQGRVPLGDETTLYDELILDNARPHHARKVREYLADHPIRILFLPPYSPQMNPIEKLWAAIKQQWRQRRVRGFPQLQATLQADLEQIVEKSGKAIVASCGYSSVLS